MNCPSTGAPCAPAAAPLPRLSPRAAFYLLASIAVTFLAGSSAPTPLYPLYAAEWGFSSVTVTIIFGIYALAVLSALLVAGRLSDHIGRRPVLLVAAVAQAAAMALFATADGVWSLLFARLIQGLSTGAAVAAIGAGLLDLDKARGTVANATAPLMGTASGGLLAGLMVQYVPAPTHSIYFVLGVIFVLQAIGVAFMQEPGTPRPGLMASLVPQFKVPAAVQDPLLRAVPALVATWALAGFYASLGPTLVKSLFALDASLAGGLTLFVLAGSGGIAVLLLRNQAPRTLLSLGSSALLAGVGLSMLSLSYHSTAAFFAGTVLSGMGFGTAFQGAIRTVMPFAAPRDSAGVLSVIFVVSYLAMGLPAVMAGYLVARHGAIVETAREFGVVVMVLAALSLAGSLSRDRTNDHPAG